MPCRCHSTRSTHVGPPLLPKPAVQPQVLTDTKQDSSEKRTCKNKSNIAIPFSSLFPFFRLLFPNAQYSL